MGRIETEFERMRRDVEQLRRELGDSRAMLATPIPLRMAVGGGSELGGWKFYIADTKAELPGDVDAPALGYVTSTGRYYVRSISGTWDALNFLE